MFWFSCDRREKLILLLKKVVSDEKVFGQIARRVTGQRTSVSLTRIRTAIKKSKGNGKIDPIIQQLSVMISEDMQLAHLLLDLRRRGIIEFKEGPQQKVFQEIFLLAKDMLDKSEKLGDFVRLFSGKHRHQVFQWDLTPQLKHNFELYKRKLTTFVESYENDLKEIERTFRNGVVMSEKKLAEVEMERFRVEIHSNVAMLDHFHFYETGFKFGDVNPLGMLIFDHDYFVAEAILHIFNSEKIEVHATQTYIQKKGYLQRAIELLLLKGVIKVWFSENSLSSAAIKMYERIGKSNKFSVTKQRSKYEVRLKD